MRTNTSTLLARFATLAALGFLVAGCGDDATRVASDNGNESPTSDSPETELTVEVSIDDKAEKTPEGVQTGTWQLTCAPVGGDHPDPKGACADLKDSGSKAFSEVPKDQMCTKIYGGPEVAKVQGHVGGKKVDTEFNKSGGCEKERYEKLGAVLAP